MASLQQGDELGRGKRRKFPKKKIFSPSDNITIKTKKDLNTEQKKNAALIQVSSSIFVIMFFFILSCFSIK